MSRLRRSAGGRAAEAGMSFQASVTAQFAAWMISNLAIGDQYGLPRGSKIIKLQCETGDALNDVVAHLEDGSVIYTECKTSLKLSNGDASDIGKVIEQLVRLYLQNDSSEASASPKVALLAVSKKAPGTINNLSEACRRFDSGNTWDDVFNQESNEELHKALELFKHHAVRAATSHREQPLTHDDLAALARMFHIDRFADSGDSRAWRTIAHDLGRDVYDGAQAGDAFKDSLLGLSRDLIKSGESVKRQGFLNALRKKGHNDVAAPGYDKDIKALTAHSEKAQKRLQKHMHLPSEGGITIRRKCLDPLLEEVENGSLLVTGEPGAGKTGVLLALAKRMANSPGPLLFLSVDRFSGFNKRSDFKSDLNLEHDPVEVLDAWPGRDPGVLIIDALDASRGGPSESVIAEFIEDVVMNIGGRWSVVASIRSFDLKNSRRFRTIMRGAPPNQNFVEKGMGDVRHFQVPRLSSDEIADIADRVVEIGELMESSPSRLQDLLRNIFNLSLAAEILKSGADAKSIRSITTQSGLIREYEDICLPSHCLQQAVGNTVCLMVSRRRLRVRAVDIKSDFIDKVCESGVLIKDDDDVMFAHHILFDHIAGRFYLDLDNTDILREQLSEDVAADLMLAPALRFALESIWNKGAPSHEKTWRLLTDMSAASNPSPVVESVLLRNIAEQVEKLEDVAGLCGLIENVENNQSDLRLLPQLTRYVHMAAKEGNGFSAPTALAWGNVAKRSAATGGDQHIVETARFLLIALDEMADMTNAEVLNVFGESARSLLREAWSSDSENRLLAKYGIRFVARSYESGPSASRSLLERILTTRFSEHAWWEAPCLAENIQHIIPHDVGFAAQAYETIFSQDVTDESETWFGGHPSAILPMTSTHQQDYQHARWLLVEALEGFLETDPAGGTAAVIRAVRGLDDGQEKHQTSVVFDISGQSVRVLNDALSLMEWREESPREETPLVAFENFLRKRNCDHEAFQSVITTALSMQTNASVWARILGIAADRPRHAQIDDLLWPLVNELGFVALYSVVRDAIIFIAAAYEEQPIEKRIAFEKSMLKECVFSGGSERNRLPSLPARFLSEIRPELLVTSGMKELHTKMKGARNPVGNAPIISMSAGWKSDKDIPEAVLRHQGADIEHGSNPDIRTASRKIEEWLATTKENEDAAWLGEIWSNVVNLVEILDAVDLADSDPRVVHSGWGVVGNGVERITKSDFYDPEDPDHPDDECLWALIGRLSDNRFPETSAPPRSSSLLSWGNWDVRVYAASSFVSMMRRRDKKPEDVVCRMRKFLSDDVPTVRLHAVLYLHELGLSSNQMWSLMEHVAITEQNNEMLYFFISGPLRSLSDKEPKHCADILSKIAERTWSAPPGDKEHRRDRNRAIEAIGSLAGDICIAQDRPEAWTWIKRWAADLQRGEDYLIHALHRLRSVLFFPYNDTSKSEKSVFACRGRKLLNIILNAATSASRPHNRDITDETAATMRQLSTAAYRVITAVCNELYFGSGTFKSSSGSDRKVGLSNKDGKEKFIADYGDTLCDIGTYGQSDAVHRLVDILDHLLDGNPGEVFDLMARILLNPSAPDGYQFEPLGHGSVVKLIRRYLADHGDVFDDRSRREKLVEVLESFASAGWPDAMKLLFDLPDIFR